MTKWTKEDAEYNKYQRGKNGSTKSSLEITLERAKDIPLYSSEEELRVFTEYKSNPTTELRDEIVMHNLRLVSSVVMSYKGTNILSQDDLFQQGILGLLRAIEKFEPDKGYKFSTYAVWWIRQSIGRHIDDAERTIRVPIHAMDLYKKVNRLQNERALANKQPYTRDELKSILGKTDLELDAIASIRGSETVSISSVVSEEHGEATELGDFIEDPNWNKKFLDIEMGSLKGCFEECLQNYLSNPNFETSRERTEGILRRRLGLNPDGTIETLEEIGKDYGITRERVRQIEAKFMKYLSRPYNIRKLREFL